MKTPLLRLSLLMLLAFSAARAEDATPATPPVPPDGTFLIADLRAPQPGLFQYGSWDGKAVNGKSGLAIMGTKGALGDGGVGKDLEAPLDFSDVTYVEVALGVAPVNEVPQVTIALNDADGTQFSARIPIDELVPGSPVWLRARRADFHLNPVEKGADSEMDWSKVTRWHVQGDWVTHKPCSLIFIALRARK